MSYLKIKVNSDLNFHKGVMSLVVKNDLLMLPVKKADHTNFKIVRKSYNFLMPKNIYMSTHTGIVTQCLLDSKLASLSYKYTMIRE